MEINVFKRRIQDLADRERLPGHPGAATWIILSSRTPISTIPGIPTPGHTCGSVSLIVDGEIAVVGDAMVGRRSIFPPFADDVPELVRSWQKLLDTGCGLFLPAHGRAKGRETLESSYHKQRNRP